MTALSPAAWCEAMDGDVVSLYAFCDALAEAGCEADADALRLLPELAAKLLEVAEAFGYREVQLSDVSTGITGYGARVTGWAACVDEGHSATLFALVRAAYSKRPDLTPAVTWLERHCGVRPSCSLDGPDGELKVNFVMPRKKRRVKR